MFNKQTFLFFNDVFLLKKKVKQESKDRKLTSHYLNDSKMCFAVRKSKLEKVSLYCSLKKF